jgi:hypothetical protein
MIKSLKLFPNFPFFKIAFIFSTRVRRIFTDTKLSFVLTSKKFVTGVNWLKSGFEMLLVGFFAYSISYFFGLAIPGGAG